MSARPQVLDVLSNDGAANDGSAKGGVDGAEERGLALLTFRAWALLSRAEPLPDDVALAAREVTEELPLDLLGGRYAMFEPEVRSTLPVTVVESWRFYAGDRHAARA